MTNFIIQNPWLAVTAAFVFGLTAGIMLMGIAGAGKCEDCVAMRKVAKREQVRVEALGK